jgi:hypothetical protein
MFEELNTVIEKRVKEVYSSTLTEQQKSLMLLQRQSWENSQLWVTAFPLSYSRLAVFKPLPTLKAERNLQHN